MQLLLANGVLTAPVFTADSAGLSITDNLDIRARVLLNSYHGTID